MSSDLSQRLAEAIALHQAGRTDEAEEIYRALLAAHPESPEALQFLGIARHQAGASDEAVTLLERAVELAPGYVDAWNNLGNVLAESAQVQAARAAYETALQLEPHRLEARNNLGVLLRHLGDYAEAEGHLKAALETAPNFAHGWYNLGNVLQAAGRFDEALPAYRRAVELAPQFVGAWRYLGVTLYRAGRIAEAAAVYREWLAQDPDNATARHMLAACTGADVPARAGDAYICEHFNRFSTSFDEQLERLSYRVPELLGAVLAEAYTPGESRLDILDLGCGTGLAGEFLAPYAAHLVGVDLSPGMLVKAGNLAFYDELIEQEIGALLDARPGPFDLVCAADVLVYFGDLGPVIEGAAYALRPGGRFVFTLERFESDEADCVLNVHGRYAHTEDYVRDVLVEAGFAIERFDAIEPRMELGAPVSGWLVAARRPA